MAELFKEKFNQALIENLAAQFGHHWPAFDAEQFIDDASKNLDQLELKARSNQICLAMLLHMPKDFIQACELIETSLAPASTKESIEFDSQNGMLAGWVLMPICDYVANIAADKVNDNFYVGLNTLRSCTQRFSAEFAIRPFLDNHPTATLAVLQNWVQDKNIHVRRLVSEGTRPYLPWGMRLQKFVLEPELILPLLECLKDDSTQYVRRSVANNLNDISKDHPDLVASIAQKWHQDSNKTRLQLIKHACRSLIKNGHPKVLALFGFAPASDIEVYLSLSVDKLNFTGEQHIHLTLHNQHSKTQSLLIDYRIHFKKANGTLNPKVFKWKTLSIKPGEVLNFSKKHSFKPITTRKYYAGEHKVEILINGTPSKQAAFELLPEDN